MRPFTQTRTQGEQAPSGGNQPTRKEVFPLSGIAKYAALQLFLVWRAAIA